MTNSRNTRIRFCENNFAELTTASVSYSSELSAFPFSNAINKFRSRTWKPSGRFTIDSTNKNIYINDGTDKTVVLTEADYATPELLASHIETQLNVSSADWTVSYNTLSGDYSFKLENTSSVTLRLSETTDSIWNTIGFITDVDITNTSFLANEQRNHTSEMVTFDMGYNVELGFFAMIAPLDEVFGISTDAEVTLMGSNLNQWSAPPFSLTLDSTSKGILRFLDDQDDTAYRFWRIQIVDKLNPKGPSGISIGHLYLGDYVTLSTRNTSAGFSMQDVDPSEITESESGVLHFDKKTKYTTLDSITVAYIPRDDKDKLRIMYEVLGSTTPFYISLDPTNCITNEVVELTKYAVFDGQPDFNHVFGDVFSMNMSFREVI